MRDADLDELYGALAPLAQLPAGTAVKIDLGELRSIGPAALAVLVVAIRALRYQRICNPLEHLIPPADVRAASWLSQSAVKRLTSKSVGRGRFSGGGAPAPSGCEVFTDGHGVDRAVDSLVMYVAEWTPWSCSDLASFGVMIRGIAENVLQHSGAYGGVAAVRIEGDAVRLAIADGGVGIRHSLARNPDLFDIADDGTAIRTAFCPQASGEPAERRGMGLYLARLVIGDNGGAFTVRSGSASLAELPEETVERQDLHPLPGTLVVADARADRPFDYDQIDEWLAQPSGVSS